MGRRRKYYHRRLKIKLKKQTVYTISAVSLFSFGGLILFSFLTQGGSLDILKSYSIEFFGWGGLIFPFTLFSLGLLLLRLKFRFARPNVTIGLILLFLSLIGITRAGIVGLEIWNNIESLITPFGAFVILFGSTIIGLTVFLDTSLDELIIFFINLFKKIKEIFKKNFLQEKKKAIFIRQEEKKELALKTSPPPKPMSREELGVTLVQNVSPKGELWDFPPLSILDEGPKQEADRGDIKKNASSIEKTLESFGITARVVEVNYGPAVTQYALEIALGTKLSKITALSNDLALALAAPTGQIRIEAPIPGRSLVGVEIPNRSLEFVTLKKMLSSDVIRKAKSKLTVSLGLDVAGRPLVADIAKMPHVLIAGTTGSGKSVLINSWIASLLFRTTPNELKLILVDPKRVELTGYNGIPHLLTPVIVEPEKIISALKWALSEMDRRYKLFAENNVRNIDGFNELAGFQSLPYIVIFIDELADLMAFSPVEVEDCICRLAQMARATGIHLVVSTQRPSVDVITGLIKANIPCRIAFNVSSMVDSRVILDMPGAEKLLGRGDMLYIPPEQAKPTRVQGAYVSEKEIRKLVEFLKSKGLPVEYTEEVLTMPVKKEGPVSGAGGEEKDPFFEEAVKIICQHDRASSSLLQRRLSIGYTRAARILDQLEAAGIIGPAEGSKPREVFIRSFEEYLARTEQQT